MTRPDKTRQCELKSPDVEHSLTPPSHPPVPDSKLQENLTSFYYTVLTVVTSASCWQYCCSVFTNSLAVRLRFLSHRSLCSWMVLDWPVRKLMVAVKTKTTGWGGNCGEIKALKAGNAHIQKSQWSEFNYNLSPGRFNCAFILTLHGTL